MWSALDSFIWRAFTWSAFPSCFGSSTFELKPFPLIGTSPVFDVFSPEVPILSLLYSCCCCMPLCRVPALSGYSIIKLFCRSKNETTRTISVIAYIGCEVDPKETHFWYSSEDYLAENNWGGKIYPKLGPRLQEEEDVSRTPSSMAVWPAPSHSWHRDFPPRWAMFPASPCQDLVTVKRMVTDTMLDY